MENNDSIEVQSNSKRARIEVDLVDLPNDPCFRKKKFMITILVIETTFEEHIYKKKKKPYQPFKHNFSQTQFGKTWRRFNPALFKEYSD
jgi:hypothetical protein